MNSDETPDPVNSYLGAAAHRALMPLIAQIHALPTREWLSPILHKHSFNRGLHWNCGSGEDTFLLASLLQEGATIHAVDNDPTLLNHAQSLKKQHRLNRIEFVPSACVAKQEKVSYDFIYTRFLAVETEQWQALLDTLTSRLSLGGVLLAEVIHLTGYSAYPYNHAFAQAVKLLGRLERSEDEIYRHWPKLVRARGLTEVVSHYTPPAFIPPPSYHIVSFVLESFSEQIERKLRTPPEELSALLIELKEFEQQANILISRSGVQQFSARKSKPF